MRDYRYFVFLNRFFVVFVLKVFVLLNAFVAYGEGPSVDGKYLKHSQKLDIVPLISIEKTDDMNLLFSLRNSSSSPFYYMNGCSPQKPVANLEFLLFKDGEYVPRIEMIEGPVFSKKGVRSLDLGQSILCKMSLKEHGIDRKIDNLPIGRYELRIRYFFPEKNAFVERYNLTPAKIDHTVALIDIIDEKQSNEKKPTNLGHESPGNGPVSQEKLPAVNLNKITTSKNPPFEIFLVSRSEKNSQMESQLCFINRSTKPIGYWKQWFCGNRCWYWDLVNHKTKKPVAKKESVSLPVPTKKDVLSLEPGKFIICKINLQDYLADMPTDRYGLRVHYSIQKNDTLAKLGCMPAKFDRTIMIVDVIEKRVKSGREGSRIENVDHSINWACWHSISTGP